MVKEVLMSSSNPGGWRLEDLLAQLRVELRAKCAKISRDTRPVAQQVLHNNEQIMDLLVRAEVLQRDSYDLLGRMAPNQGPLGKPRIGEGSED